VTLYGFLRWARGNPLVLHYVELVTNMSSAQFGLRPLSREDEGRLISDLLAAFAMRGLRVWCL
jgi:hypothetical protein